MKRTPAARWLPIDHTVCKTPTPIVAKPNAAAPTDRIRLLDQRAYEAQEGRAENRSTAENTEQDSIANRAVIDAVGNGGPQSEQL